MSTLMPPLPNYYLMSKIFKIQKMNRAMTKILTHTRMIIICSKVKQAIRVMLAIYPAFRGSSLVLKDETGYLTTKKQIINR